MTIFWTIRRACTACGKNAKTQLRNDQIGPFRISYGLCDECAAERATQTGTDLLPINGSQRCFYCEEPAQHASENQEALLTSRQQRIHYTCNTCDGRQKAAFQRAVARHRGEYAGAEEIPAVVVLEMDEELCEGRKLSH
jgi:hypothetical protein